MSGEFGYETEVVVKNITVLGCEQGLQGPVALNGDFEHVFGDCAAGYTGKAPRRGLA
jgi:alpha-glucosidase